ncbi:MAG TPA: hypothetical protein VF613_24655 [Longimicrobium sp.]|jgi:hypothetical protein
MGSKLIEQLLQSVPQLTVMIFGVVALALLLKEYAKLRGEIKQTTEEVVNAKLGALIGEIQVESQ